METNGERIKGSRWFRWHCEDCGRAIRIHNPAVESNFRCAECSGLRDELTPPPHPATLDGDAGGYQNIAIRHLEDDRTEL